MGTEIDIPSGILCRAIAIVREMPKEVDLVVDIKVAIPSGMLCNIIASIEIIPTLYKELLLVLVGNVLSITVEMIMPKNRKVKHKRIIMASLKLLSIFNDSGIRSVIETQIMTPAAKARLDTIILFSCFNFINIGSVPIRVDSPASVVNKKAIFILFIYITT